MRVAYLILFNILLFSFTESQAETPDYSINLSQSWTSRLSAVVKNLTVSVKSQRPGDLTFENVKSVQVDFVTDSTGATTLDSTIIKNSNKSIVVSLKPPTLDVHEDLQGKIEVRFFGSSVLSHLLRLETPVLYRSEPAVLSVVLPNFTIAEGGLHVSIDGKNFDILDKAFLHFVDFSPSCKEKCQILNSESILCKTPNLLQPSCNQHYQKQHDNRSNDIALTDNPASHKPKISEINLLAGQLINFKLSENIVQPDFAPLVLVRNPIFAEYRSNKGTPNGKKEIILVGEFPAWKHMVAQDVRIEVGGVICPHVTRHALDVYTCTPHPNSDEDADGSDEKIVVYYGNLKFDHVKLVKSFSIHPIIIVTSSILGFVLLLALFSGITMCCYSCRTKSHDRKVSVEDLDGRLSNIVLDGADEAAAEGDSLRENHSNTTAPAKF